MATTADRKAQVARRLYDICTKEFGLDPEAVLFDCLTFTLATGDAQYRHSAVDTLDGIRRIKAECPGALTILGVSNVSFGLAKEARPVVNSVFLYHAVQAGLDAAIVNPKDITPYPQIPPADRALCDDLIFDRRPDALQQIIARFAEGTEAAAAKGGKRSRAEELKVLPPEERIHRMILERHGEGVEEAIDGAMKSRAPVAVINEILLPAMKEVGDRFGAGELILPFVLQSAEVMKRAVAYVEKFLDKNDAVVRGKVVLATVYGDVHDIGKNLVKTILSNNGYKVWDLGKQVPIGTILEKAVEVGADAIGLSALLVSTSKQMPACVKELDQRGLKFPVLLGGAAINRKYGLRTLYVEGDRTFAGGVYYARDAFEGLDIMNALMGTGRAALEEKVRREAHLQRVMELGAGAPPTAISATEQVVRSEVKPVPRVPEPPFWGVRVAEASELDLRGIFECLDLRELFKLQWGVRAHGEKYERLLDEEFRPLLRELQDECIREGHFTPRVVYGYFPVRAEGNDLVVLDPQDRRTERVRFHYPRQPEPPRLCLSDYYADGKRLDVAAFQVVTVGDRATRLGEELDKDGHFSRALFIHGLAVETAEAMAEFWHRRVRREMGLADRQGKRYSPGYPAWPELEDQAKIWKLLEPDRNIGVTLTSAHQMVPEQSTSAIVVHHPDALYFSLRPGRESRAPSFDPMR
jgi:5-methyltetrahydrofolate--homocysteine methyltransferase